MTESTSPATGTALLNDICDELVTGSFFPAMHRLCEMLGLLRGRMTAQDWREFCKFTVSRHPIREVLGQGPITSRWLRSPPEQSGDTLAFDLICGRTTATSTTTSLGKMLYGWEYGLPFSEAIRRRQSLILRELNEVTNEDKDLQILSLGHSHLAETTFSQARGSENSACIDGEEQFDFIYALDLFDTLDTETAINFLPGLIAMLKLNGRLLVANLSPHIPDAAYLEACMDYSPRYRSEEEMAELTVKVPASEISSQCVFRDEGGHSVFLEVQRRSRRR